MFYIKPAKNAPVFTNHFYEEWLRADYPWLESNDKPKSRATQGSTLAVLDEDVDMYPELKGYDAVGLEFDDSNHVTAIPIRYTPKDYVESVVRAIAHRRSTM